MDPENGYPDEPIVDLAAGRQRALDALATMRRAQAEPDVGPDGRASEAPDEEE